jgi:hypothetical protein
MPLANTQTSTKWSSRKLSQVRASGLLLSPPFFFLTKGTAAFDKECNAEGVLDRAAWKRVLNRLEGRESYCVLFFFFLFFFSPHFKPDVDCCVLLFFLWQMPG